MTVLTHREDDLGALEEEEEGTPVEPRKAIMPRLAPPTTPPERRSDPDNIVKLLAALGAPSDATNTSPVLRLIWTRALSVGRTGLPVRK